MAAVVRSEKEDQLVSKYENATLVQDWIRMIHDQVDLIRLGLTTEKQRQTIIGGVDVLQLILGDFWEMAVTDVGRATQELKDNGFGKYVGEA